MLCAAAGVGRSNNHAPAITTKSRTRGRDGDHAASNKSAVAVPVRRATADDETAVSRPVQFADPPRQRVDRPVPAVEGVDPLAGRQLVGEGVARLDVLDPQAPSPARDSGWRATAPS